MAGGAGVCHLRYVRLSPCDWRPSAVPSSFARDSSGPASGAGGSPCCPKPAFVSTCSAREQPQSRLAAVRKFKCKGQKWESQKQPPERSQRAGHGFADLPARHEVWYCFAPAPPTAGMTSKGVATTRRPMLARSNIPSPPFVASLRQTTSKRSNCVAGSGEVLAYAAGWSTFIAQLDTGGREPGWRWSCKDWTALAGAEGLPSQPLMGAANSSPARTMTRGTAS